MLIIILRFTGISENTNYLPLLIQFFTKKLFFMDTKDNWHLTIADKKSCSISLVMHVSFMLLYL